MPGEAQYLVIPNEGTYNTIMFIVVHAKWYNHNRMLRYNIKELGCV